MCSVPGDHGFHRDSADYMLSLPMARLPDDWGMCAQGLRMLLFLASVLQPRDVSWTRKVSRFLIGLCLVFVESVLLVNGEIVLFAFGLCVNSYFNYCCV